RGGDGSVLTRHRGRRAPWASDHGSRVRRGARAVGGVMTMRPGAEPAVERTKPGFREAALPHLDAVYRFALRLSGSPDDAADLTQETFLRAYRSWHRYTPGTRAKSWLFTICRNLFLRSRERVRRHDRV